MALSIESGRPGPDTREYNCTNDSEPDNILLTQAGNPKIGDFGASKQLPADGTCGSGGEASGLRGTPAYMSPETMRQEGAGRKADVWALGGVALFLATGDPPWRPLAVESPWQLLMRVGTDPTLTPPLEPYLQRLGGALQRLLEECFRRDPRARPDAKALLHHDFFHTGH